MTDPAPSIPAAAATAPAPSRWATVQSLRGIAIILVMVSHLWVLVPTEGLLASPFGGLFRSGNLGVSVFFVLAGFFLVRSLMSDRARDGRLDVKEQVLRRWARISAHVYTLVLVMLVATALDAPGTFAPSNTPRSVLRIVTYTWNWFAMREPLLSRPDAGHLWFTSVYLQVAIFLILLVAALGGRRRLLLVLVGALIVAVTIWRAWSYANEGPWVAFLRTTTRMDGMIWGALLALALPWLPKLTRTAATALLAVASAALLVLSLTATDPRYFGLPGVLICLMTALFVYAVTGGPGGVLVRLLSWAPLVVLGNYSMALYIWHYPVYWVVSRHSVGWSNVPRLITAFAIIAVLAYLAQRYVEGPVTRWLAVRRRTHTPAPRAESAPEPRGLRER